MGVTLGLTDVAADAVGGLGAADVAGGVAGAADALPVAADVSAGLDAGNVATGLGGALGSADTTAAGGSWLDSLLGGISTGASDSAPAMSDIGGATDIGGIGASSTADAVPTIAGTDGSAVAGDAVPTVSGTTGTATIGSGTAPTIAGTDTGSSTLGSLGNYLGKQNPLNLALASGSALSGINSLIPKKQVNVGQTAANVMATNPSFSNPNLPQYTMQNTATPYQGNWYTYGQQPEAAMYNAQPAPVNNANAAKKGGLMGHYAHGGMVHKFAMGGPVPGQPPMSMPPAAPPMGAPPPQMPPQGMGAPPPRPPMQQPMPPKKPMNPLAMKMAAHKIGVVIGKHMKQRGMTPDGRVKGHGGGQDDIVPARLSKDEYVIPADVTAQLGDGSSEAGGKKLDAMLDNVRKHKTGTTKYPPMAKNPLAYIPKKSS